MIGKGLSGPSNEEGPTGLLSFAGVKVMGVPVVEFAAATAGEGSAGMLAFVEA